jgi:hypothetical protein
MDDREHDGMKKKNGEESLLERGSLQLRMDFDNRL